MDTLVVLPPLVSEGLDSVFARSATLLLSSTRGWGGWAGGGDPSPPGAFRSQMGVLFILWSLGADWPWSVSCKLVGGVFIRLFSLPSSLSTKGDQSPKMGSVIVEGVFLDEVHIALVGIALWCGGSHMKGSLLQGGVLHFPAHLWMLLKFTGCALLVRWPGGWHQVCQLGYDDCLGLVQRLHLETAAQILFGPGQCYLKGSPPALYGNLQFFLYSIHYILNIEY